MSKTHYLMTHELRHAVQMARVLSMPLLLTGEPGVGKSSLARALAEEQAVKSFELKIHSDTRYRDLFYCFDDVGRFSEASVQRVQAPASSAYLDVPAGMPNTDPRLFIRFVGLGAAILQATDRCQPWLAPAIREADFLPGVASSVVLIDEIDKAPRDVPNDLLVQLDQWRFEVPEFARLKAYPQTGFALGEQDPRPFVVITSNKEKTLPDAFLRRCVYFHIELPPSRAEVADADVTLDDIVLQNLTRLSDTDRRANDFVQECIAAFGDVRKLAQIRKPGLAELLNWVHYLVKHEAQPRGLATLSGSELQQMICSLLLKDHADHELLQGGLSAERFPALGPLLSSEPASSRRAG